MKPLREEHFSFRTCFELETGLDAKQGQLEGPEKFACCEETLASRKPQKSE